MSFSEVIEHEGKLWNYVYVNSNSLLTPSAREHFAWNVIDTYVREEETRNLKHDDYEGRLANKGRIAYGGLAGTLFDAIFETDRGKGEVSILVMNNFNPNLN
jgi:hypothetical protein